MQLSDVDIDPEWALVPQSLAVSAQPSGLSDSEAEPLAIRLPTELLLHIFTLCIQESENHTDAFNPSNITILTHVCRRWRLVALDYPLLWSTISFRSPYLTRIMLDRSQDASISIRADFTAVHSSQVAPMFKAVRRALRHASRAKEINLRSHAGKQLTKLLSDFRPPGELLESLSLRGIAERYYHTVFDVPADVFAHATAWPLRRLVLERVKIPPGVLPGHCPHLVHLEMHYVTPLGVDDIIAFARAASSTLECLILDLVPLAAFTEDPPPQIQLPRFKRLHLNCIFGDFRANSAFVLLPIFAFPPTASLRLQVLLSGLLLITPHNVLPALVAHTNAGDPLRSILISQENLYKRRGLRLHGWTSRATPTFFELEDMPPAKIDVHLVREADADNGALHRALLDLVHALPLLAVQSVTLARLQSVPPTLLTTALPLLPALREVTVHGSPALRALCDAPQPSSPPPLVLLAALHTLSVYEAAGALDFQALRRALEARVRGGRKLPHLIVCYSDVPRRVMEGFAGLADEILWDGSVRGTESVPVPVEVEVPTLGTLDL